jgi:heterodisulfide reductase subunit C
MDLLPHEIVRYLQLGFEQILDAKAIWLCATCFSCKTQCPRGVDVSKICEALRVIKLRREPIELQVQQSTAEIPQQGLVSAYRKLSSY